MIPDGKLYGAQKLFHLHYLLFSLGLFMLIMLQEFRLLSFFIFVDYFTKQFFFCSSRPKLIFNIYRITNPEKRADYHFQELIGSIFMQLQQLLDAPSKRMTEHLIKYASIGEFTQLDATIELIADEIRSYGKDVALCASFSRIEKPREATRLCLTLKRLRGLLSLLFFHFLFYLFSVSLLFLFPQIVVFNYLLF